VISDLKPYPAYKDSGIVWMGDVPEHWEMRRIRNTVEMRVSNIDKHTKDGELAVRLCNYVDVYNNNFITEHLPFMRATATKEEIGRFRLVSGDVLITKDSEAWNDIGVPAMVNYTSEDLVCGYHLALLRPRAGLLNGAYLLRALQSPSVAYQFHVAANGVTRYGLSHDAIKSVFLPVPPHPEQDAIVSFLDHYDRKIRRYIRAKQKLIKLLEEQKQAIIHRAVTRGLDPTVRLKPSGVGWLGDVPEHWEVVSIRRRWTVTDCKHLTVPFFEAGIPLASVREAQSFDLKLDSCNYTTKEYYEQLVQGGRKPQAGDLIYCRNVSVGAAALVTQDDVFAMGQDVCLIRSTTENQRWFNYYLHSKAMADQLALILVGSTFNRINVADIKALLVPVPPRFEQDQITSYLDRELEEIEAVVAVCLRQQNTIREYRTRLISDVVTGKLDVRGLDLTAAADAEAPDECSDLQDIETALEDQEMEEEIPAEGD